MPDRTPRTKAEKQNAVHEVMHEYKHGELHSGSKKGPKVKSRKQAIAIAMSESNQSKPKGQVDRSAHFKGNPGFPSKPPAGESPAPSAERDHEKREKQVMGAGYKQHERAFHNRSHSVSHGFGHSATQRSGHHRLSGHSGAHRIGKK